MKVWLRIDTSPTGVLAGTLEWPGCPAPVQFHGTLELVAALEAAAAARTPGGD
jgi:hypothetical protein